jgi:hypothetical protein
MLAKPVLKGRLIPMSGPMLELNMITDNFKNKGAKIK